MKKAVHVFLILVFGAAAFDMVRADVPPEPGFKRITVDLVVEAKDDFPDHRFFFRSGARMVELSLTKGQRETLRPMGGGAFYRSGSLIAIPKANLKDISSPPNSSDLDKLIESVNDNKVNGGIQLINHSFIREVREGDEEKITDAGYSIERAADGPKAHRLGTSSTEEPGQGNGNFRVTDRDKGLTIVGWFSMIAGVFIFLAAIATGLWLFFRSKKAVAP